MTSANDNIWYLQTPIKLSSIKSYREVMQEIGDVTHGIIGHELKQ